MQAPGIICSNLKSSAGHLSGIACNGGKYSFPGSWIPHVPGKGPGPGFSLSGQAVRPYTGGVLTRGRRFLFPQTVLASVGVLAAR